MSQDLIGKFFRTGRRRQFSTGEIITDGIGPNGAFYISQGFVKVYSISDDGTHYVHIIYKAGEIFPYVRVILDTKRRVFYEAITPVVVFTVSQDDFVARLQKDSKLAYETLCQLAEQFSVFADRIDNLQYKSAYGKVIYRLLFLAGRFGRKTSTGILIEVPVTHELIAQTINLARESVSRQIEKLEKAGLITYDNRYIELNDIKALSQEFSAPVSLDLWGLVEN